MMYKKTVQFDNNYSASVVCNDMSYGGDRGLFEVAILYNNEITYDTPITKGVVGFLDFQGVADTFKQIEKLPRR